MNNISFFERQVDKETYEIKENCDTIKNKVFYLKGLLSRPKKDDECMTMYIGDSLSIVTPMQRNKDIDLQENEIMITDGKSKIHFIYEKDTIKISTKKIEIESEDVIFNSNVKFEKDIIHKNIDIGKDHTHKYTYNETVVSGGVTSPAVGVEIPKTENTQGVG